MDPTAASLGTAATSARTSPDHTNRNPSTSAQLRPSLVIDTAACDSNHGDLLTSTKLGPLTCSAFGPRTSSDSYCAGGNNFSTADAAQELHPFRLHASQQQPEHHSQAGFRSSGVGSNSPHSSRASRQPKVVFGVVTSSHTPSSSSSPGAAASPHAVPGSSTPRTKARLSTAAAAGVASSTPRLSTAAAAGLASPSGSSKSPGSSISGSDGAAMASVAAGNSSSAGAKQARASAIEAAKHYGSWFLPTQDWSQVSRLNPGSTWSRESMHLERIEQQHQVAQQLGLLNTVIDEDADAADLWPASSPGGTAAMAAAHAATVTAAAAGSKSDPGLSSRGLGSPAYRRSAAPSVFARSTLGSSATAAPSIDATGAGAGSSAAVDGFLQDWYSHQSGQRSSVVAARVSLPGAGQLQGTTSLCVTHGLERGLSDNLDSKSFWSCSSPGPGSRFSSSAGTPNAADRQLSSSTGGARCRWGAGSAQPVTDLEQQLCSGSSSPLGRRNSSTAGCLTPNMPRPSQGIHAVANSPAGGQIWLGHEPATEEAEQEGTAAALADQQYYEQLHALAAQQAQLHGQLRDTFALKAYKDYMHTKGFRQPGSLRRLPTPTDHDIELRQKQQLLQQAQQQQTLLQRQLLSRQRQRQQQQLSASGSEQQQQQQQQPQAQQQVQQLQQASSSASSTVQPSAACLGAAADVTASTAPPLDAAAGSHSSSSSSSSRQPSGSTCSSPRMSLALPSSRLRASSTSPHQPLRLSAASPRCSQAMGQLLRPSAVAKPDELQQQQQQQQWGAQAVPRLQMTEVQQQQLQDLRQLKGSCHPHSGLGSDDWQLLTALLTGGRQAAAAAAVGAHTSRAATSAGGVSNAGGSESARECVSRQQASRSFCSAVAGIGGIDSSRAHSSIGSSRRMCHSSRDAGSLASSCKDHGVLKSSSTGGSSMSGSTTGGSSMSGSTSTGLVAAVQAACSSGCGQLQPAAGSSPCQTAAAGPAADSVPAAQFSKAPSGSCGGLSITPVSMGQQQQQQQQPIPALQAQIGILQQDGSFDCDSIDLVEPFTPMTPATLLVRAASVPGTAGASAGAAAVGTAAALGVGWGLDAELAASILDPESAADLQQLIASYPVLQTSRVLGSVCGVACSEVGGTCTLSGTDRNCSPQHSRPGTNRSSTREPWTAATSQFGSLGRCSPTLRPLVPTFDPSLLKPVPCDISYTLTSRREPKPSKAVTMLGKAEHRSCSSPRSGKSSSGCYLSHGA